MRKLSHEELQARRQNRRPALPFTIVLNNIRSLYNVGSIFRTADGAGMEKLYLCGITGLPPDSKISKTALGAEKTVAWEFHESVISAIKELKAQNYQIVLLEQTQKSISYEEFCPHAPVCLVVGNEISGIQDQLLSLCDVALDIPMAGNKISLNVSVAFGIAAYQLRSKLKASVV